MIGPGSTRKAHFIVLAIVLLGCMPLRDARAQRTELETAGPTETTSSTVDVQATNATSGGTRNPALIASVTIFVLAIFVGFELITKVPPTLHTPLMSGSNAISGITLVGALLAAGAGQLDLAAGVGMLAVVLATINAVGGFMVTDRMLAMFQKKK
jgi:NAD(P) transhydrogenase subunit alpha